LYFPPEFEVEFKYFTKIVRPNLEKPFPKGHAKEHFPKAI